MKKPAVNCFKPALHDDYPIKKGRNQN